MAQWINLDAICEILEDDIKTGDELVNISRVRSWLLDQSKIIIPDSVEALYNADYRKASDVAEEIFAEIERTLDNYHSACLPVGQIEAYTYYEGGLGEAVAELKKKYTEEGK